MNVFAVSRHPVKCARALDDKRLNKMILETAQIICTVLNLDAGSQVAPYKNCHVNHPVVKWAREPNNSSKRMRWLYALGIAYGEEIIYRHGRKHSCHLLLEGLPFKWPFLTMFPADLKLDDFHNGARHKGLGLDFTHLPVGKAYRAYLRVRWKGDKRPPKWTRRGEPIWR